MALPHLSSRLLQLAIGEISSMLQEALTKPVAKMATATCLNFLKLKRSSVRLLPTSSAKPSDTLPSLRIASHGAIFGTRPSASPASPSAVFIGAASRSISSSIEASSMCISE